MRIEIINTGSELLLGTTLNTHGAWMGMELFKLGLRVQRQITVPDGEAINSAMAESMERSDVVIVTGGLGPTSDDITREAAAEVLGVELITDEAALRSIEAFFADRNREMAEDNKKQALNPVGGDILPNPNGTAPGIYTPPRMSGDRLCALFLLPGPPSEMRPMFENEVEPRLRSLAGTNEDHHIQVLRFTGVGESDFHAKLDQELVSIPNLEVGYCARTREVDLRLIGAKASIEQAGQLAINTFPDMCFSQNGESLEEIVVQLLQKQGKTISIAESCTGGLIANRITNVAGASQVFTHGFVSYSNLAKQQLLNVNNATLERHGAVSEATAIEMAEGALANAEADIAISVTGIAGPSGGSEEKPVGTVWIGIATAGSSAAVKKFAPYGRDIFKQAASQDALNLARRSLEQAMA
ncbi:MAG: competence/damage-inducible protein A [Akkermansiaceae bacterium]|nr:competence/damage-inducible protein A [Akkermansiaceae bacterium]